MKLESIDQDLMTDTNQVITRVVLNGVASHCSLARQLIDVLGRPGIDNDMEMLGTNSTWTIVWSEPSHTLEEATHLINQAIAPRPASTHTQP
ncbi:MAG: hypothetical protein AAFV72_20955 [Cyanobacteria bacterium J06635_1]